MTTMERVGHRDAVGERWGAALERLWSAAIKRSVTPGEGSPIYQAARALNVSAADMELAAELLESEVEP